MKINIKALRSTFFFLGNITAIKGQGSTEVDLSTQPDTVLNALVISINSKIIEADTDAKEIADWIKDQVTKEVAYSVLGIALESGEFAETVTADLIAESDQANTEVPNIVSEEDEYQDYINNLKDLLDGNVKIVIEKLSNAGLSDEDKIKLIDLEQQDKNRKAVLTAINEL